MFVGSWPCFVLSVEGFRKQTRDTLDREGE